MIIVAVMAGHDPEAQTLFDGGFQVPVKGNNSNSAFDGDCDIAYALLLADAQWGSGGAVRYKDEALTVIAGILASTIGPNRRLPMLGDWVRSGDAAYSEYTPRSSDFMPGHFRSFGKATGDPVWTEVVNATQSVITSLQTHYSALTGLLPDFIVTES